MYLGKFITVYSESVMYEEAVECMCPTVVCIRCGSIGVHYSCRFVFYFVCLRRA